jgi:hypothetical protein
MAGVRGEEGVVRDPRVLFIGKTRRLSSIHAFRRYASSSKRTCDYIIKGGITARSLRNFSKHYLAMVAAQMLLAAVFGTCDSQSTPATNRPGANAPLFNDA